MINKLEADKRMKKPISIVLQEYYQTLERNKAIRWRHEQGERIRDLAKQTYNGQKLTKQAISVICHRKDFGQTYPGTHQNGFWGSLWQRLIHRH